MTPAREAIGLPMLFLTVLLLGSARITDSVVLLPPTLFALVLAVLLLRVLVQCGALAPDRLLGSSRSAIANVNGLIVFVALWAAGAQTMSMSWWRIRR